MRLVHLLSLFVPIVASGRAAGAQGVVTPTSHWGGIILPELQERTQLGLHVVSFSQFGKEVHPGGEQYTFTPYNDLHETLGFNFVTFSRTRAGRTLTADARQAAASAGAHWRRETILVGIVSDVVPVILQNEVMHGLARWVHWPGYEQLRPVPRRIGDTPAHTSRGPTKGTPLLELSEEFFVRLGASGGTGRGASTSESPFFVGGGFALGTINQELFLHGGATVARLEFERELSLAGIRLRSVGVGGMARVGLLAPGYHFPDVTTHYVNLQGVLRADLDWWSVPTYVELTLTSANGFFVATRTPEQLAMIRERGADPEDVYQAKSPLAERFLAVRVRIGDFTFETYNDVAGGKDKGPTFGAHATLNVQRMGRSASR